MTNWLNVAGSAGVATGTTIANGGTTPAPSGDTLTVATSSGGSVTYTSDKEWRCVGNAGVARFDLNTGTAARIFAEVLVDIPSWPTGSANRIAEIFTAAGYALRFEQGTDGRIQILTSAPATIFTTTNPVPVGPARLSIGAEPGSTTSNGKVRFGITTSSGGGGSSYDAGTEFSSDAANVRSATTVSSLRVGRVSSTAGSAATVDLRVLQAKDTDLTPIGPYVPPDAPLEGTATQGVTRTISMTGITGGVPPLDSSLVQTSGPSVTLVQDGSNPLIWTFEDDTARTDSIVLSWEVTDSKTPTPQTLGGSITVLPGTGTVEIKRVGRLIKLGGTAH